MKKKIIISLTILICLVTLSACKKENTEKEKELDSYSCLRTSKGVGQTMNTTLTVHINKKEKFEDYQVISVTDYQGEKEKYQKMKKSAENTKKELKDKKGFTLTLQTNDEKTTISETRTYTKEGLYDDVKAFLNADESFDIKGWKESLNKKGFTCKF